MVKENDMNKVILTHIEGFDQYLKPGIPWGSVCMVIGGPGTLKTTFTFTILYNNMKLNNLKGLYISLEQSKDSLLNNMGRLGMTDINPETLEVADYGTLRLMLKKALDKTKKDLKHSSRDKPRNGLIDNEVKILEENSISINWLDDIQKLIHDRVEFGNVDIVVIDSLNGLYALTDFINPRRELFHFFGFLREINVTSLLIAEAPPTLPTIGEYGVEQFLSDGIFELGVIEEHEPMRYIQVKKIRGIPHDMSKYAFKIDEKIRVWGKLLDTKQ
jgi:KaiC/GvpD/RAD55 family RecA-like ATPase